jgi:hypothetical protein
MNTSTERDLRHARDCAEIARSTNDSYIRHSCLELEKEWLVLAGLAKDKEQLALPLQRHVILFLSLALAVAAWVVWLNLRS